MSDRAYFKNNNFDLVRLLAASQVAVLHSISHLGVDAGPLTTVIGYFPGVPAFFFISGFLISASWERNPRLREFGINRALRIFPALWGVLIATLVSLFVFYEPARLFASPGKLALWITCQATFFPQWNPDFLRGYGVGVVNGSLWTIPVEMSFYVATPALYWLMKRARSATMVLAIAIVASFAVQYGFTGQTGFDGTALLVRKLVKASFIPWIGMFCMGVLVQRNIDRIYPLIAGRAVHLLALYAAISVFTHHFELYPLLRGHRNSMGMVNYIVYCALVLSVAYTKRDWSDRLLRRNDISYGMYILHMPVINAVHEQGVRGWGAFFLAVGCTTALATASWLIIEKPALRLKPRPMYQHG